MKVLAKVIITTTLLLGLLVSATPVNAYDLVTNVEYETYMNWGNTAYAPTYKFRTPNGLKQYTGMAIYTPKEGTGQYGLYYITSGFRQNIKKGQIYSFTLAFDFSNTAVSQDISSAEFNRWSGNNQFNLLGVNRISGRDYCANWTGTDAFTWTTAPSGINGLTTSNGANTTQGHCSDANTVYEFILEGNQNLNNIIIEFGNQNQESLISWIANPDTTNAVLGTISVSPIRIWNKQTPTTVNEQQQQAGEQAQQDGQTAANQGQQSTDQQGASLIQGASNIIGALTDTTPGSCNINLNMGVLDMGQQNFCQGDIGPIRPIIATITNILFAFVSLRVFVFLIGVMFGLFDQFLGTKTEMGGGV